MYRFPFAGGYAFRVRPYMLEKTSAAGELSFFVLAPLKSRNFLRVSAPNTPRLRSELSSSLLLLPRFYLHRLCAELSSSFLRFRPQIFFVFAPYHRRVFVPRTVYCCPLAFWLAPNAERRTSPTRWRKKTSPPRSFWFWV